MEVKPTITQRIEDLQAFYDLNEAQNDYLEDARNLGEGEFAHKLVDIILKALEKGTAFDPSHREITPKKEKDNSNWPPHLCSVPAQYRHMRLTNFQLNDEKNAQKAWESVQGWFDQAKGCAMILGPYGAGKTHLAVGSAVQWNRVREGEVYFADCVRLYEVRKRYYDGRHCDPRIRTREAALLILDDLPWKPEKDADFREFMQLIINDRLLDCKPFMITSNLISLKGDTEQLKSMLGPRLVDRLRETQHVKIWLKGKSKR